ncbi:hypothetical protein MRX96_051283 [Rhipicephalus microplus]
MTDADTTIRTLRLSTVGRHFNVPSRSLVEVAGLPRTDGRLRNVRGFYEETAMRAIGPRRLRCCGHVLVRLLSAHLRCSRSAAWLAASSSTRRCVLSN